MFLRNRLSCFGQALPTAFASFFDALGAAAALFGAVLTEFDGLAAALGASGLAGIVGIENAKPAKGLPFPEGFTS